MTSSNILSKGSSIKILFGGSFFFSYRFRWFTSIYIHPENHYKFRIFENLDLNFLDGAQGFKGVLFNHDNMKFDQIFDFKDLGDYLMESDDFWRKNEKSQKFRENLDFFCGNDNFDIKTRFKIIVVNEFKQQPSKTYIKTCSLRW